MIATSFKDRLPKSLAYPVGAEAISAALSGAPYPEELSLSFRADGGLSRLDFQRVVCRREPYTVLLAQYRPVSRPNIGIGPQASVPRWSLVVHPVLSEFKHAAGQILRNEGLLFLRRWFEQSSAPGWRSVRQQIDVVLTPTSMTIEIRPSSGA